MTLLVPRGAGRRGQARHERQREGESKNASSQHLLIVPRHPLAR
jgi:hypothetical protein